MEFEPRQSASRITVDGDCSHEIRRHLPPGRKVITNLDSILKSKDITLPTKVHIVKAMIFPVVVYGYGGGPQKRQSAKRRMDYFELCFSRRLLRVPWTARSNQSLLKEINPDYSLEGLILKLKLQYFGKEMTHWKTSLCWERLKAKGEEGGRG